MPSRGLAARRGGDEHHGVAVAHDDGAVGLLGQPAGLDREGLPPTVMLRVCMCSLSLR